MGLVAISASSSVMDGSFDNPTVVAGRCRLFGPEATSRAALADGCNKAAEKEGSLTSFVLRAGLLSFVS